MKSEAKAADVVANEVSPPGVCFCDLCVKFFVSAVLAVTESTSPALESAAMIRCSFGAARSTTIFVHAPASVVF